MGIRDYFNKINQYDQAVRENMRKKKPGIYCSNECFVNDGRCKECLEIQKRIERAVNRIEQIEKTMNLTEEQIKEINKTKRIKKCSFCSAPYEIDDFNCPYCGTPYPKDVIDFEIPVSLVSRSAEISKKTEEAWGLLIKKWELVESYNANINKQLTINDKIRTMLHGTPKQNWPQTAVEINWAANLYGIGVSQYIQGVAMGQLQSPNNIYQSEQDRNLQQQIGMALGINIPNNNVNYASATPRYTNNTATNTNNTQVKETITYKKGEKCSTCHYYLAGSNRCKKEGNKQPTGPNDTCPNHIKKPSILRY